MSELRDQIHTPFVYTYQVARLFPDEPETSIRYQLSRWATGQKLIRLKRGLYLFPDRAIDELALSALLYQPSYVSLETALNLYGIIPDITATVVTAVTTTTSNTFTTPRGKFIYSRLKPELFFGYTHQTDPQSQVPYSIAEPEKALLDWIYIRRISDLEENRVNLGEINQGKLEQFSLFYPDAVKRILL